jgi:DNA primase
MNRFFCKRSGEVASSPAKAAWLTGRQDVETTPDPEPVRGETYRLERQMVAMMLQFPEMIADIERRRLMAHFTDPFWQKSGRASSTTFGHYGSDIADLVSRWDDPKKKAVVARLSLTDEHWDRNGCRNLINQFDRQHPPPGQGPAETDRGC